jgi:GNAT superfamily N-acetyltransferase
MVTTAIKQMITFKYEFESGLGPMEAERYIRQFLINIISEGENEEKILAGKAVFKIVYLDQALNNGYNPYDVFDFYEYTFRLAEDFYDFDESDIKENIRKFYHYDFLGTDICILERIEILPEFRGHNIAAKAIKDIIFHFGSTCGLFVIQAYPLQFEVTSQEQDDWLDKLELKCFPGNEKLAFTQLRNYYKSIGFKKVPGCNNLLFYNPSFKNTKMDAIDLEESS